MDDVHVIEKASDTIHELRHRLECEPVVGCVIAQSDDHAELVERCDYSYNAAGDRLRSMLADVNRSRPAKTILFTESTPHVTLTSCSIHLCSLCLLTST